LTYGFLLFDNLLRPFYLGRKHELGNLFETDKPGHLIPGALVILARTVSLPEQIDKFRHLSAVFSHDQALFTIFTGSHKKIPVLSGSD
jgi:hypothetical protein